MKRRSRIRLRNRVQYAIGLFVDALLAPIRALNPNTWRNR